MGHSLKMASGVLNFMGGMTQAKGLEQAGRDTLESSKRTAADLRARGIAHLARGTHEYEDLNEIRDVVLSDFDAQAGGGGGDPSVVKRRAQVEGAYSKRSADALRAAQVDKQSEDEKAKSVERDALSLFNYYNAQAAGARFNAFASLVGTGADAFTLYGKYGAKSSVSGSSRLGGGSSRPGGGYPRSVPKGSWHGGGGMGWLTPYGSPAPGLRKT